VEVVFSLLGETISDYNEGTYWYPQMCCGYRTALLDARNPSLPRVELTPNASVGDFFSAPELANFLVRPAPPDEYEVYDAGTGLTGTLLGGSSAPGGLDVSFQSTAGGVLLAEYDPLTSQELSERIVDGDLQVLDFAVPGDTIQLWEIEYTLGLPGPAPFTNATVTFSYDEALLGPFPEGALAVYHFQSGSWHRLASTVDTANNRITVTVSSFSPFVLGLDPACDDGLDGDGDGATDFPGDPGCADPEDASERDPGLVCDDGLDQDGDTLVDYPADPGCRDTSWTRENPGCDDDLDNDGDGGIDWDGGPAQATPDPQCVGAPWRNKEMSGGCGLGGEVALLLVAVRARGGRGGGRVPPRTPNPHSTGRTDVRPGGGESQNDR
jgi:hypothetical protein